MKNIIIVNRTYRNTYSLALPLLHIGRRLEHRFSRCWTMRCDFKWRLTIETLPSHGGNRGSNPQGVPMISKACRIYSESFLFFRHISGLFHTSQLASLTLWTRDHRIGEKPTRETHRKRSWRKSYSESGLEPGYQYLQILQTSQAARSPIGR